MFVCDPGVEWFHSAPRLVFIWRLPTIDLIEARPCEVEHKGIWGIFFNNPSRVRVLNFSALLRNTSSVMQISNATSCCVLSFVQLHALSLNRRSSLQPPANGAGGQHAGASDSWGPLAIFSYTLLS